MVGNDGDGDAPSPSPPRPNHDGDVGPSAPGGRSCKGLLYYSSTRKNNARNPLCFGFSRPEGQVQSYVAGKSEQDATRDGKALLDFKYACVGYSVHRDHQASMSHRNQRATLSDVESEKQAELPLCMGIEVLAERRASQGASATRQEQMSPNRGHKENEAPILPRPPSSIRPPSPIGSFTPEDFSTRFLRSAGLVAGGIVKNLSRVGNSIKSMAIDIFHPDRGRPK